MKFFTGVDYPHVCLGCRAMIDSVAQMFAEGEMADTDDEEAPCMYIYDNRLYCGGHECVNKPKERENA